MSCRWSGIAIHHVFYVTTASEPLQFTPTRSRNDVRCTRTTAARTKYGRAVYEFGSELSITCIVLFDDLAPRDATYHRLSQSRAAWSSASFVGRRAGRRLQPCDFSVASTTLWSARCSNAKSTIYCSRSVSSPTNLLSTQQREPVCTKFSHFSRWQLRLTTRAPTQ